MALALKQILIKFALIVGPACAVYIMIATSSCECLSKLFFNGLTLDATQEAGKWLLIRATFARVALFLFVHTFLVMHLRVVGNKISPATESDPTSITTLNRVITNSIEQTIIFAGLYVYFLFDVSGDRFSSTQLVNFVCWFILGRILFSVGYIIGTLTGISTFRSLGMAFAIGTNVLLIENIFLPKTYLTPLIFGISQ